MREMSFRKRMFLLLINLIILSSCNSDVGDLQTNESLSENDALSEFASVLSSALSEKRVRDFIRTESLKEIDDDYDVVYYYVKDELLDNGLTFHENVLNFAKDRDLFNKLVEENKLLTIYVPTLNEDFSAKKWNIDTQIPCVAVRANSKEKEMKVFGRQDCDFVNKYLKPNFPVLVVKTNERLIEKTEMNTRALTKGLSNRNGVFAYFLDESFDKANEITTRIDPNKIVFLYSTRTELLDYSFLANKECPRDYVYYKIGAGKEKGNLVTTNREFIVALEFANYGVLEHVKDGNDPTGDWSDGNLELVFDFVFVDKEGAPTNYRKMISARIDQMFSNSNGTQKTLRYILPEPVEIFNWDLYTYGNIYKVSIFEQDPGTTINNTISHSSSFGTNFEASSGTQFGLFKVGAKFGGSTTNSKQTSVTTQTTNNSDQLGDVIVNFFDPIYLESKIKVDVHASYNPPNSTVTHPIREMYTFNTSNDLWAFIDRIKNGQEKFSNYPFCLIYDETIHGDTYMSNTGMIKLKIQPMSLVN